MADIDYNEVFGLDDNIGEAAAGPAEADPESNAAASQTDTEQEAPAENPQDETPQPGRPASPEQPAQSPQENARYVSIRRRAEAEARKWAEKEVEEKLRRLGAVNPETGLPAQNREEYEAAQKAREAQDRDAFMKANNMDEAQYREFVGSLPEVRAARIAEEQAVGVRVETQLNEELRQIQALDSSVTSLQDLRKSPAYGKLVELVKRGNSLVDAFKLTHFDSLTRSAADKEKQATLNRMRGKAHLTPVSRRQGSGMQPVPTQVMEQYRLFNPGATDEEIQRHYNNELMKGS